MMMMMMMMMMMNYCISATTTQTRSSATAERQRVVSCACLPRLAAIHWKPYVAVIRTIIINYSRIDTKRLIFSATECVSTVQGHPRSTILVPIESAHTTSIN